MARTPSPTRGKTAGQSLIKSFAHDYLHGKDSNYKPLYTQDAFEKMVAGFKSEYEHTIYLRYVAIYNGLVEEFVRAHGYYHQAMHGLTRIQAALSDVYRAQRQADILCDVLSPFGFITPELTGTAPQYEALSSLFVDIDTLSGDEQKRTLLAADFAELLLPALRALQAYNTLLGLLADVLKLADIRGLQLQLSPLESALQGYHEAIAAAQAAFLAAEPPRTARAQLLCDLFPAIQLESMAPAPALVAAAQATLAKAENHQNGIVQRMLLFLLGEDV